MYFANDLTGTINQGEALPDQKQVEPGDPINIVLMGSDTREGKGDSGAYGNSSEITGARSDTTIVVHISGDRQHAMAVSIPRDSSVTLPMCKTPDGTTKGGYHAIFNAAFELGGPTCTVKLITQLTGLDINHYVVVDFAGFKNVVDALGGVDVCLKNPVNDPDSHLVLSAGEHTISGNQALAFVRARKTIGDGSDLSRIQRQQEFLSSAIRKATSAGVLANPFQLYSVAKAAAKSLTTDPDLANIEALQNLALMTSDVKPSSIVFATVPTTYDDNGSSVTWVPSESQELWDAMRNDEQWPAAASTGVDGKPLTAAPADITVNLQNASGVSGQALKFSQLLANERYQIGTVTSASKKSQSVILYNPNYDAQAEAARTLSYATGLPTRATTSQYGSAVTLLVGSDMPTSLRPVVATPKQSPNVNGPKPRSADQKICAAGNGPTG